MKRRAPFLIAALGAGLVVWGTFGARGYEERVKGCGASRRVLASGLGRIAQGD